MTITLLLYIEKMYLFSHGGKVESRALPAHEMAMPLQ